MNQLYNKYLQKKYNSENLNERNGKFFDPNQFKIFGKKKQKSERERETERERERAAKPSLWFKINRKEFEELTRDI